MNLADFKNIWIFAEHSDNELSPVYGELLGKAKELASDKKGCKVCSIVLGDKVENIVAKVESMGTDIIYYVNHEKLEQYNCDYYLTAIEKLILAYKPEIFLIGATALGSEIAPSVAARVRTGLAAHCVDIAMNEKGNIVCMVPAFGGKVISEILIPKHRPQMASVRPGIFAARDSEKNLNVETIKIECSELDDITSGIEYVSFVPSVTYAQKLEDAEIVICGGRGVASEENWGNVGKLAKKFNAAVGYTRCVLDQGWVEDECDMIGTSGKSIRPKVYLGIGVSGATHHVCGMNKSRMIININRDKNAKIFSISDYKIVADSESIVKALLEKLS